MAFPEFDEKFFTRWAAELDQELQEFKRAYRLLSLDDRSRVRTLMTQATAISREFGPLCRMYLTVGVANLSHDPDGEINYFGHANLSPNRVLEALDAWDRGEEYTPNPMPY